VAGEKACPCPTSRVVDIGVDPPPRDWHCSSPTSLPHGLALLAGSRVALLVRESNDSTFLPHGLGLFIFFKLAWVLELAPAVLEFAVHTPCRRGFSRRLEQVRVKPLDEAPYFRFPRLNRPASLLIPWAHRGKSETSVTKSRTSRAPAPSPPPSARATLVALSKSRMPMHSLAISSRCSSPSTSATNSW